MKNLLYLFLTLLIISCTGKKSVDVDEYSIDQFYKNIRLNGGYFSADESKILISSDETGIFNLFEIDLNSGEKKMITSSAVESFFAVSYLPGSSDMIYSADQGGNELDHLFLLRTDGSVTDLTPGEQEKANFGGFSKDKKTMYYLSNKRDPRFFDLYKMSLDEWKSEMLYKNDQGLNVSGFSNDENIIALQKNITTSENQLFLYDRTTKKLTEVSDPESPGSYSASDFSDDGKIFYYLTNGGKEFAYLVKYDIASNEKTVTFETDWDVMYSIISENEKYEVIAVNEDGKNSLVIRDYSTGESIDFPEIPDGDIINVRISDSEQKMVLAVGSSKAPVNLYLYEFETGSLRKLTETLNPEINPYHLVSSKVVRFRSFDSLEIPAIYTVPHIASAKNKVPALVWVHGGPGGQSRIGYSALIQYLVNHGYAILAVNNRGSSGYGKSFNMMDDRNHGDKDLKDCIAGKNWLMAQENIDGENIGIIGGSYGGYMTMAAMTFAPGEFKAGVNIFGVTNWLRTLKSIPPYWEANRKALYNELGDPFTADSIRLYEISPLFHAQRVTDPVMVLQGANDPRVLQVESDEIVAALKENNVPVEYVVFPDEGHGFIKKENEIKGYGQVLTFLDKYLKPAK